MKHGMAVLLVTGLMLLAGCQNKELIQCQADNDQLKTDLEQQKASTSELMDLSIKDTEEMNALKAKADADLQASKEAHKQDVQKLDNSIKALLKTEGEKKQLEAKVADLEKALTNAADMTKAQADENTQLKAKIADLETQLQAAKAAAAAPAPAAPATN